MDVAIVRETGFQRSLLEIKKFQEKRKKEYKNPLDVCQCPIPPLEQIEPMHPNRKFLINLNCNVMLHH
ncbi:hypothetical protein [Methanobrevibacter millerae]|uniref:hypothetical protein n=1 Tax=Methanobrevibacter millerae TaxID=230361 RepID=UPI00122C6B53|nr:hypothetical protein [Methanobrevibacter millerae]